MKLDNTNILEAAELWYNDENTNDLKKNHINNYYLG